MTIYNKTNDRLPASKLFCPVVMNWCARLACVQETEALTVMAKHLLPQNFWTNLFINLFFFFLMTSSISRRRSWSTLRKEDGKYAIVCISFFSFLFCLLIAIILKGCIRLAVFELLLGLLCCCVKNPLTLFISKMFLESHLTDIHVVFNV